MLPRYNRIVEPGDFRQVIRRGDKKVTDHLIVYRRPSEFARVGVVITTKCGNAVVRNTLRRRTRAITRELIRDHSLSGDVVIRFRCEGRTPTFTELSDEIRGAVLSWPSA